MLLMNPHPLYCQNGRISPYIGLVRNIVNLCAIAENDKNAIKIDTFLSLSKIKYIFARLYA